MTIFFGGAYLTHAQLKKSATGTILGFLMLFPSTALAGDLTSTITALPTSILTSFLATLPPATLATWDPASPTFNPTTANFALLSPAQIDLVLDSSAQSVLNALPSDTFFSFSVNQLSNTLGALLPTNLGGLTTSLTSLPSSSLATALDSLPPALLSGLSSNLFSGVPSAQISTLINSMSSVGLSGLTSLAGLTTAQLSSVLPSITSSLLGSLPSTIFSGLSGTALNGVLSGLPPGVLESLGSEVFSSLPASVLGSLSSSVLSALGPGVASSISSAISGVLGGPFVPVKDFELIAKFTTYSKNFDTYAKQVNLALTGAPDSIRATIAGGNPGGVAKTKCATKPNPYPATAYSNGSWADASSISGSTIPLSITSASLKAGQVAINDSASLRCLLQELVEWEKLGLSIQIHSMLKTYIADAQAKQLNNQLVGKISAANLNWAKSGNEVVNNSVVSTEAVYNTNASQSIYNVKARALEHTIAQAAGDPASGDPIGSLGICEPWRLDTAANSARNNKLSVEDPMFSATSRTQCGLANPSDFGKFSDNFNDPSGVGGMDMFISLLSNPAASPLGAATQLDEETAGRLARQEQAKRDEFANTGARADIECSGTADDPYCLDTLGTAVTPQFQNQDNVTRSSGAGFEAVQDGNTLDGGASGDLEDQSVELNTSPGGLLGYSEAGIANAPTAVNELVREFYDVIDIGYFGISAQTTDWAQATMLMIYDEMKFSSTSPEVIVTAGAAADPTGY